MIELQINSPEELLVMVAAGNPLIVNVLGNKLTSGIGPEKALDGTLDVLLDGLPRSLLDNRAQYEVMKRRIKMLSLVGIDPRLVDINNYLFPEDENSLQKTHEMFSVLIDSRYMRYERKGYVLDGAVKRVAAVSMMLSSDYPSVIASLIIHSEDLKEKYPGAASHFDNMPRTNLL